MVLLPWFTCRQVVLAVWMAAAVSTPGITTPDNKMEAYIKDLPQERRSRLVTDYASTGLMFPGFLKYRTPPHIYVSCPKDGCAPSAIGNLETLQSHAPATLGRRIDAADTSGIEIYLAPEPDEFAQRDRGTDARLGLNAYYSAKTILNTDSEASEYVAAPCRTAIYFDKRTGVIEKSLVFIDSDAPSRLQGLCMAFAKRASLPQEQSRGSGQAPAPAGRRRLYARPSRDRAG